jgi:hypothetical protein
MSPMLVDGLPLPKELVELIESGRWPRNHEEAKIQDLTPLVPAGRFAAVVPYLSSLYLYPPPFHTAAPRMSGDVLECRHDAFWLSEWAAPHELDLNLAIPIGDFGIGSDSPFILDYRPDRSEPVVMYLRGDQTPRETGFHRLLWGRSRPSASDFHWAPLARTFRDFARTAGLI